MTQTQLTEALRALGAQPDSDDVSRWEANIAEPELRTFAALARALGVAMEVLLYGERVAATIAEERERAELPPGRPVPVAPGAPMMALESTEPRAPTPSRAPGAFETLVMALVNSGVVFVFLAVLLLSLIVVIIARAILRAWGTW